MLSGQTPTRQWNTRRSEKARRLASVPVQGKVLPTGDLVAMLEKLIAPGDKVVLEGNNQKQADFLSRSLAEVNPQIVHDLHMIMPSVGRSEHLDIFEKGIARKLDFSFSGTQSLRISQLLEDGQLEIGAIHTYIELYSRLYVDLSPNVALIAGFKADRKGNLYTGASTEDTPALVEAAAFHDGIVIAQVNELVDDECDLPRVDIPGSWIDFVVVADKPFFIEPLFTRDPRLIKQEHILMAMMAIKGIYAEHQVQSLNHGIGFNTAAIVDLRRYTPVVGIVAGTVGCFGGMSIAAALCSYLIVTREARLGLNGPQVIEQEAGIEEYDSRDRPFIWSMTGGEVRYESGLVDALVGDGVNAVKAAMNEAIAKGVPAKHRTDNYDDYLNRLTNFDTRKQADAEQIKALFAREVK